MAKPKKQEKSFTPAVVVKPAPTKPPATRCGICGLIEMDCVGHLGVHESFLTFDNGLTHHYDKAQ